MRRRQRGVTLISLLIGMLLSSLCILAMLGLYRNLVQTAVVATHDANQDGQIAAGLLTAQLKLQSAGFGMESGVNLDDPSISLNGSNQRALLWRYKDNLGYQCRGLTDRPGTDDASGKALRILSLLQAGNCSAGASLAGLQWTVRQDLARQWVPAQQSAALPLTELQILHDVDCTPFGFGQPGRHPQVVLNARSSAQLAGSSAEPLSYRICLPNIAE
ncbi:hypothetical protein D9M71_372050 [compost metagenome]